MTTKTFYKLLTALLAALLLAGYAVPVAAQEAGAADNTTAAADTQEKTGTLYVHRATAEGKEIFGPVLKWPIPVGSSYDAIDYFLAEMTLLLESEGNKVSADTYQFDPASSSQDLTGTMTEDGAHVYIVYQLVSSVPLIRMDIQAVTSDGTVVAYIASDFISINELGRAYDLSSLTEETRTGRDGKLYRYVGLAEGSDPLVGNLKEGVNRVALLYEEVKESGVGAETSSKTSPDQDSKASSATTPASQAAAKQGPAKNLPSTGDAGSWLLTLVGTGLLTVPFIKRSRK